MNKLLIAVVLWGMTRMAIAQSFDVGVESPFRGKNRMTISLHSGNYVVVGYDSLPDLIRFRNLDSLLRLFATHYALVTDSTTSSETDAQYIRYSFNAEQRSQYLTIRRYPAKESHYRFKAGTEPVELKQLQDTLLIRLFIERNDRKSFVTKTFDPKDVELATEYFNRITSFYVVVNHISDVVKGRFAPVNPLLNETISKAQEYRRYNLTANKSVVASVRMVADSGKVTINAYKRYRPKIEANYSFGLAYIGGNWASSARVGVILRPHVELENRGTQVAKNGYGILLELESNFFFDRQSDGSLMIQKNQFVNVGFVAFKPRQNRKNIYEKPVDEPYIQLKAGILVEREGSYFAANMLRFSPVFRMNRNIYVEPELYFNSKKSYPGLRLSVQL